MAPAAILSTSKLQREVGLWRNSMECIDSQLLKGKSNNSQGRWIGEFECLLCITFSASTVPEKNPVFRVTDVQKHTVSLAWAPPVEPNGILTGYLLEYQLSTYRCVFFLDQTNSGIIVMNPSCHKEIFLFPLWLIVFTFLYFFLASSFLREKKLLCSLLENTQAIYFNLATLTTYQRVQSWLKVSSKSTSCYQLGELIRPEGIVITQDLTTG